MVRKKTPRKNSAKTTTTERDRRTGLSTASTAALHAEIERRLKDLEQKRKALSAELDALDQDIAACAGAAAAPNGRVSSPSRTTLSTSSTGSCAAWGSK